MDPFRPFCPLSLKKAQALVEKFVEHYYTRGLDSAIGYGSPFDKLHGNFSPLSLIPHTSYFTATID
jgi:hypothetical protein